MANFATRGLGGLGLEPATERAASLRHPSAESGLEVPGPGLVSPGTSSATGKAEGVDSLFSHWSDRPGLAMGAKDAVPFDESPKAPRSPERDEEPRRDKNAKQGRDKSASGHLGGTKQDLERLEQILELHQTTKGPANLAPDEEPQRDKNAKHTPDKSTSGLVTGTKALF